jgi:hypothetical protein
MCTQKTVQLKSNSSSLDLEKLRQDRHTARDIAQQYSSVTFFSLRFFSCKEKFSALLKKYVNSI